jgi:hypothetical protein
MKHGAIFPAVLLISAMLFSQDPGFTLNGNLITITWTESLAAPGTPSGEVPFSVFTGPYIGWKSDTSATIRWQVAATTTLRYEPYGYKGTLLPGDFQFRHIEVTGLMPDTRYRYVLKTESADYSYVSDTFSLITMPSVTATHFKFAFLGDTRGHGKQGVFTFLEEWDPVLFFNNGDIASGSWGYYLDSLENPPKDWYRVYYNGRGVVSSALMAPALGNWDVSYRMDYDRTHAEDYFQDIPANSNGAGPARPPFYYSFDVANVHFVGLCTEMKSGNSIADGDSVNYKLFTKAEQLSWLEEDLKNTDRVWKVVCQHSPGDPFWISHLLKEYNVQLLLTASAHAYARGPRSDFGSSRYETILSDSGTVQVLSGGAGALVSMSGILNQLVHHSVYHHVRAEVFQDEMQFFAVDSFGDVFDAWKLSLVGQPETLGVPARIETALPENINGIRINPNPISSSTAVTYKVDYSQKVVFTIYDIAGRIVKSMSRRMLPGVYTEHLPFHAQLSGIFIIKARINNRKYTDKLICLK